MNTIGQESIRSAYSECTLLDAGGLVVLTNSILSYLLGSLLSVLVQIVAYYKYKKQNNKVCTYTTLGSGTHERIGADEQ